MPAAPKLKRVFSGITITLADLKTVAYLAESLGGRVEMKANAYRLTDIDQVRDVLSEDVVIDTISVLAWTTTGGGLQFTYEPGYILVQADDDVPDLREPFGIIVATLQSQPRNGLNQCALDLAPTGVAWQAPKISTRTANAAIAATDPKNAQPATTPSGRTRDSAQLDPTAARVGLLGRWWRRLSQPKRDKAPS